MDHHIWCNYFMQPEKDCKMCKRLREKYPDNLSPDGLQKKYFPDAIKVESAELSQTAGRVANQLKNKTRIDVDRWAEGLANEVSGLND